MSHSPEDSHIYDFLRLWLQERENIDNPDNVLHDITYSGLCDNLYDYTVKRRFSIFYHYQIKDRLMDILEEKCGDAAYPFNENKEDFIREASDRRSHLNEKRLIFVKSFLEAFKPKDGLE